MLIDIKHINIAPRMDGGSKPFHPENAIANFKFDSQSNTYILEILDKANPEFRVIVVINNQDILSVKTI